MDEEVGTGRREGEIHSVRAECRERHGRLPETVQGYPRAAEGKAELLPPPASALHVQVQGEVVSKGDQTPGPSSRWEIGL